MPIVCRNVPNRTRPRLWKPRDVVRVACTVIERGGDPQDIVRGLRTCPGVKDPLDKACELAETLLDVVGLILDVLDVVEVALILILSAGGVLKRFPFLRRVLRRAERALRSIERARSTIQGLNRLAEQVLIELCEENVPRESEVR